MNPDTFIPDWSNPVAAHHNVRVVCDLQGLTWEQKQILTACVMVESGFNINAVHQNKDGKGHVLSTDYGIVQVNDYWHIGQGKDFPSVEYVLQNPQACVEWMAKSYKTTGSLNLWCSFTSGMYRKWLNKV